MTIDTSITRVLHGVNTGVHEHSSSYFHTRPIAEERASFVLPSKRKYSFDIFYDIKDLFTIAAITQSSVLMTGGTDVGKTTLAKLIMSGLFGREDEGWHRVDVNTDFGKEAYSDVQFDAIGEGQTSQELYRLNKFYTLPGFILDEINRTHARLANILLHILDKDVSLPNGARAQLGIKLAENGGHYQFQVAAINEGAEYHGTFDLDKAMRRRTVIEIPMDIFPATPLDRLMIQKNGDMQAPENGQSHLEHVLMVYNALPAIRVHEAAELFIAYLEAFDFCRNSLTGDKSSVETVRGAISTSICASEARIGQIRDPDLRIGCPFLRTFENNLCPYVRGTTPGVSKRLLQVAKGFAALRAVKFAEMMAGYAQSQTEGYSYSFNSIDEMAKALQEYTNTQVTGADIARHAVGKYLSHLEVEIEDVEAAVGFVGFSKIGIAPAFVTKHYQGNRFAAITNFIARAKVKFMEGLSRPELDNLPEIVSGTCAPDRMSRLLGYCEYENPWMGRAIGPYLHAQSLGATPESVDQFLK